MRGLNADLSVAVSKVLPESPDALVDRVSIAVLYYCSPDS